MCSTYFYDSVGYLASLGLNIKLTLDENVNFFYIFLENIKYFLEQFLK
jgi:hypothetical protein